MLRFAIRDLLWLTVVVALAVAWWSARRELAAEQEFRSKLEEVDPPYGLMRARRVWIEPEPRPYVEY